MRVMRIYHKSQERKQKRFNKKRERHHSLPFSLCDHNKNKECPTTLDDEKVLFFKLPNHKGA